MIDAAELEVRRLVVLCVVMVGLSRAHGVGSNAVGVTLDARLSAGTAWGFGGRYPCLNDGNRYAATVTLRRRIDAPTIPKPVTSKAQLAGSGTIDVTETLSRTKKNGN
jgi:hypothetical protein